MDTYYIIMALPNFWDSIVAWVGINDQKEWYWSDLIKGACYWENEAEAQRVAKEESENFGCFHKVIPFTKDELKDLGVFDRAGKGFPFKEIDPLFKNSSQEEIDG